MRNITKRISLVSLLLIFTLVLGACGKTGLGNSSSSSTKVTKKSPKDLTIGISVSTTNNPFFVLLQNQVKKDAEAKGMTVKTSDAQNDAAKQTNDVETFVTQGVDAILINPVDSDAIVPAVKAANNAGIPVVTLDRGSNGGDVLSTIVSDNVKAGELVAQYIVDNVGEDARTLVVSGTPGASATIDRTKGFKSIADKSLKVLSTQSANYDRATALNTTQNMLQANSDVQAIFAMNDEEAMGAVQAVKAAGKSDIIIVGIDGSPDANASIKAGDLTATVAQQPRKMGKMGVQAVIDYYQGKKVKKQVNVPVNLVTKETADKYQW